MGNAFDQFDAYAQCCATTICLFSLAERFAISLMGSEQMTRSFATWDGVLEYINDKEDPFISEGRKKEPNTYFKATGRTSIARSVHHPETKKRVGDAVKVVLDHYIRPGSPLSILSAITAPGENVGVVFILQGIRKIESLFAGDFATVMFAGVNPGRHREDIINRVTEYIFGAGTQPKHPRFQSFALFDPIIVPTEFFGPTDIPVRGLTRDAREALKSYDMFAVVREPRGWDAVYDADVNVIVRDLLWIRRGSAVKQLYIQRDDGESNPLIGVYVSAVDRKCFLITSVNVEDEIVYVAAELNAFPKKSQKLAIHFPTSSSEHPLQIRDAQLSGVLNETNSLGAWKALLIRPKWEFCEQLRAIIDRIPESKLKSIYALCLDVSAVGVIFSSKLREEAASKIEGGEAQPNWIQERREAFRRLTASDKLNLKDIGRQRDFSGRFYLP